MRLEPDARKFLPEHISRDEPRQAVGEGAWTAARDFARIIGLRRLALDVRVHAPAKTGFSATICSRVIRRQSLACRHRCD